MFVIAGSRSVLDMAFVLGVVVKSTTCLALSVASAAEPSSNFCIILCCNSVGSVSFVLKHGKSVS